MTFSFKSDDDENEFYYWYYTQHAPAPAMAEEAAAYARRCGQKNMTVQDYCSLSLFSKYEDGRFMEDRNDWMLLWCLNDEQIEPLYPVYELWRAWRKDKRRKKPAEIQGRQDRLVTAGGSWFKSYTPAKVVRLLGVHWDTARGNLATPKKRWFVMLLAYIYMANEKEKAEIERMVDEILA